MPRLAHSSIRLYQLSFIAASIVLGLATLLASPAASAQEMRGIAAEGYITATHLPAGFDVNGTHVSLDAQTGFKLPADKASVTDSPLRQAIQTGVYVWIVGDLDGRTHSTLARIVIVRDDWDQKLSGFGVIDRVISAGAEPVFQADGYRIRVPSGTQVTFQGALKTLADVGTNTWLRYQGTRDKTGTLLATTAEFLPAKPAKVKTIKEVEEHTIELRPASAEARRLQEADPAKSIFLNPDGTLNQDAEVKLVQFGSWHRIPMDPQLQQRVRRVGMNVVPAYQKQLPADHPSKIAFRFYAVDAPKFRTDICSFEGLILIPMQMVERLKSDDQLAAVLADGVAFNLQRQAARLVVDSRLSTGALVAGDIAGAFVPGLGLATLIGSSVAGAKEIVSMNEQRERVALSLLADAGYDPRQAPEAWRLLAPKQLPADLNSLKYPNSSGYQLGILNLQYNRNPADEPALDK